MTTNGIDTTVADISDVKMTLCEKEPEDGEYAFELGGAPATLDGYCSSSPDRVALCLQKRSYQALNLCVLRASAFSQIQSSTPLHRQG
ncbi:MAG: hypothetical protein QOE70_263 [Chthoniobacter sp.]|jgi:hypothetical protein|nr:hypothetical protein [Chthoniobacter sp.]